MAPDTDGNLYFADNHNNRIRVIAAPVVEEPHTHPRPNPYTYRGPNRYPRPDSYARPDRNTSPHFNALPTSTPTPQPTPTPVSLPDLVPGNVQFEVGQTPACRLSPG